MSECVVAMPSRTSAERGRRAAVMAKIDIEIVSIDPTFTKKGCSIGIKVKCEDADRLIELLDKKKISYGDVIGRYQ